MAEQDDEDRQLEELLGELRVVLPGTTVLFAFLLTLPFTGEFSGLTAAQRLSFFIAFLSTAGALILLTGETAYHRLAGKPYDKRRMLVTASRQTVAAVALLLVALPAVIFLVSDVVYRGAVAVPVTAAAFVLAASTWVVLPLMRRWR
ncbi:MAG: DUF6328 family protein [Chloroflexota bacterium]|nr:DUF6328 family protein [Chloroflexota bacterium]